MAFADRKKIVKVWSVVVAVAVVVGMVVAGRVEVAAVMVVTMAVMLVSPLTFYRPSAAVLFRFVLKLIFSENKKNLKQFLTQKPLARERSSLHQKV